MWDMPTPTPCLSFIMPFITILMVKLLTSLKPACPIGLTADKKCSRHFLIPSVCGWHAYTTPVPCLSLICLTADKQTFLFPCVCGGGVMRWLYIKEISQDVLLQKFNSPYTKLEYGNYFSINFVSPSSYMITLIIYKEKKHFPEVRDQAGFYIATVYGVNAWMVQSCVLWLWFQPL